MYAISRMEQEYTSCRSLSAARKANSRNIDAKIAVDEDTLRILNQEKFPVGRQDLWYVPLQNSIILFESNICHIPAGENIQLYPIHFNFNGLELDEKYVLPLTIEEDPSYVQNKYKGRYKALLGVNLFNDYPERITPR